MTDPRFDGAAGGEALARLYDLDLAEDPGDLDLYVALAARTGGPILELAAGTGRLTIPLAQAGYEVTAVDVDPAMLAGCGASSSRSGRTTRRRQPGSRWSRPIWWAWSCRAGRASASCSWP